MDTSPFVEDLIVRAKLVDTQARDQLLIRYRNYLRMIARVWIDQAVAAKMDPSDVVQETLLRAHRAFEGFHGASERELTAWLRKILARYLIDVSRKYHSVMRSVSREHSLEADWERSSAGLAQGLAAAGSSPSQQAQRRELTVLLADALEQLKEEYREVIILRSLEELDWSTVAQRMGRSTDAARMLWTRALCELRPHLKESP